jgi:hypothetical protein
LLFGLPLVVAGSACALIDSFQGFTGATDAGAREGGAMPDVQSDTGASDTEASGTEADACPTGSTLCGGSCVDASTDGGNCGSCGMQCSAPSYCSGGQCLFKCPSGTTYTVSVVSTAVVDGTYEFLSSAGFALDDPNGGIAGTGLDQYAYVGDSQQWTVTGMGGGAYKILAQNGLALTGQGANTQVDLEPYTGSSQQLFAFVRSGSGWNIVDMLDCYAIGDSGGGIHEAVVEKAFAPGDNNQSWTLTPVASVTAPVASGTYEITDIASGDALDDNSGGGSGTVPDLAVYAGANQQWAVTLVSGVQYKIIAASGAALTMSSMPNSTIAALSGYTGANDQLWVFWPSGNGSAYGIVNVGTGLAADDHGGGGVGVQIQQWVWNNNSHQQWALTPAP